MNDQISITKIGNYVIFNRPKYTPWSVTEAEMRRVDFRGILPRYMGPNSVEMVLAAAKEGRKAKYRDVIIEVLG